MAAAGFRAESMSVSINFKAYDTRSGASVAAADLLADLLREGLARHAKERASLVVSGGSTPGPCFDQLANRELDWSRVTILPSDERWVSSDHGDSNERLIRNRLLRGQASKASILPFFREGIEAWQAPPAIEQDLRALALPFDVSLLGMGEDGHFASLFPDFPGLDEALDPDGETHCITVQTAGSPHLRISLTLSALLRSEHIVLLIFGKEKRTVFEAAERGEGDYPIEALLKYDGKRLTVIWAP